MKSNKFLFTMCPFCHSPTSKNESTDSNKRVYTCGAIGLRKEQQYIPCKQPALF